MLKMISFGDMDLSVLYSVLGFITKLYTSAMNNTFLFIIMSAWLQTLPKNDNLESFEGLISTSFKNALHCCVYRYKRKTQSVHVFNSTTPTWLNFTLLKENLDEWSQVNDFGLRANVIKMNNYNSRSLFLSNLKELENSLSNVAELVAAESSSLDRGSAESSIIQFKVTENVRMKFMYLMISICDII